MHMLVKAILRTSFTHFLAAEQLDQPHHCANCDYTLWFVSCQFLTQLWTALVHLPVCCKSVFTFVTSSREVARNWNKAQREEPYLRSLNNKPELQSFLSTRFPSPSLPASQYTTYLFDLIKTFWASWVYWSIPLPTILVSSSISVYQPVAPLNHAYAFLNWSWYSDEQYERQDLHCCAVEVEHNIYERGILSRWSEHNFGAHRDGIVRTK